MLGLLIGIGLAFVRDYLFKGIADPGELESRTGLARVRDDPGRAIVSRN